MSHSVIKVSLSAIDQMKMTYSGSLTASVPQGAVFQAKPPGCTITAYKSGKVLFQGKTLRQNPRAGEQQSLRKRRKRPKSRLIPAMPLRQISPECLLSVLTKSEPEITLAQ